MACGLDRTDSVNANGNGDMGRLRSAGALWIAAGITCAGLLIFVFIGENLRNPGALLQDPALPALMLIGAIVALLTGTLLINHPGPGAVRWSNVAGIAWLLVFGSLLVGGFLAKHDPDGGPLVSTGLITGFGVAGALLAYWSRRRGELR